PRRDGAATGALRGGTVRNVAHDGDEEGGATAPRQPLRTLRGVSKCILGDSQKKRKTRGPIPTGRGPFPYNLIGSPGRSWDRRPGRLHSNLSHKGEGPCSEWEGGVCAWRCWRSAECRRTPDRTSPH